MAEAEADPKTALDAAWLDLSKEYKTSRDSGRPTYELINVAIVFVVSAVKWLFGAVFRLAGNIQKPMLKWMVPRTYFNPY